MTFSLKASIGALITLLLATLVKGSFDLAYCSPANTAGDFQALYSIYQSNGLCQNSCSGYAFFVLQGPDCWCSNYAPSDEVNTLECNEECPGYTSDWCGSQSAGLYGYYQLSAAPSGTIAGVISPTSAGSSDPPATSSSTQPQSTTSALISTSTPSTTDQPSQVYTSVMTVTGQVRTIVVTPTSTADPSSLGQGVTRSGGLSTGQVVGIVLGVALGLGLLIGLAVWFWLRRKHQNKSRDSSYHSGYAGDESDTNRTTPSRQVSQMSSSGLLGKGPRIITGGYGLSNGNGSGNGTTTNPRSPDTVSSNGIDRRSLGTDQRLNPYALFAHEESRMSSVSLQDNQDYSRQLRIANPD